MKAATHVRSGCMHICEKSSGTSGTVDARADAVGTAWAAGAEHTGHEAKDMYARTPQPTRKGVVAFKLTRRAPCGR